mgnify:CR=1 FL=1
MFRSLFGVGRVLIAVVHLPPLPGSPLYGGDFSEVLDSALRDALAAEEGGADAVLVENFGDRPYPKRAPPETVAAMAVAVREVAGAVSIPVGVNVLRNDPVAALAVAHAAGGRFIRCNAYVDTIVADQGVIEPAAWELELVRSRLGRSVLVLADVHVKHAVTLGPPLEESARSAVERGMADALIVTGPGTGRPPDPERVRRVREAVPSAPVLVGSGVTPENAALLMRWADGAIVGTYLKREGRVDPERVRRVAEAVRGSRRS